MLQPVVRRGLVRAGSATRCCLHYCLTSEIPTPLTTHLPEAGGIDETTFRDRPLLCSRFTTCGLNDFLTGGGRLFVRNLFLFHVLADTWNPVPYQSPPQRHPLPPEALPPTGNRSGAQDLPWDSRTSLRTRGAVDTHLTEYLPRWISEEFHWFEAGGDVEIVQADG